MQIRNNHEIYGIFLEFVAKDIQKERHLANRRMMNVFFWCFLLPAVIAISVIILVKFKILPKNARNQIDWLLLILPVLYSLYILSFEVLIRVPAAFKKGGIATTLGQSLQESAWRERVVDDLKRSLPISYEEWKWVIASFKLDLESMQYRTKYLTALAGAVFFLIMQGIDSLTDGEGKAVWFKTSVFGWVETSSNDLSQFVGLALFLMLLYLSGSQTYQSLKRYLHCAELIHSDKTS